MLGDEVMAAALIDRVLHHYHLANIRGNSDRLRDHTAWRPTQTREPPPASAVKLPRERKAVAAS